jgi:hypothetical protein
MPITPRYYRQQRLPGRLGAGHASPQVFSTSERALGNVGKVLEYRGLQIQERHDQSKISSGYNEYRDVARMKLSELLQLKGESAVGLGEKYDEWFNDFASDYAQKRLGNNRQRRGWQELVTTRRGHDLDILARHEAQEMARFQVQAEAGLFTTTVDDISSNPWDDRARDVSINIFMEKVKSMHPGEDVTALKDKYEKQIHAGALQAMINDNPKRAAAYLEDWKDIIGPDEYKRFKAQLDTGVSKQNIEGAYIKLEQMYGKDSQAKLKHIRPSKNYKKLGLDLSERDQLNQIITGEYNTDKALQEEAEKQRDEQDVLAFQDALIVDQNVKIAWHIADTMQNPNIRGRALALVENYKFSSDPEMLFDLKRKVNMDPGSMDVAKIWEYAPEATGEKGVNGQDLQAAQQRWEALMREAQEKPDKYALRGRMLQIADHLRSKGVYSDGDRENELIWSRVVDEINDKLDANPEWTDKQAEDWLKDRLSIYNQGWIARLIDKIFGGGGGDLRGSEILAEDSAIRYFTNRGKGVPKDPVEEYAKLRQRAVDALRKNNKLINEDTIRQIMDQFDDAY